jgi:hypothetical protein
MASPTEIRRPERLIARIINYSGSSGTIGGTTQLEHEISDWNCRPAFPRNRSPSMKAGATLPKCPLSHGVDQLLVERGQPPSWIFLTRIYDVPILVPLWPDVCEIQNNVLQRSPILCCAMCRRVWRRLDH